MTPTKKLRETVGKLDFSLIQKDQYGSEKKNEVVWEITKDGNIVGNTPHFDYSAAGIYDITATVGDKKHSHSLFVTPSLNNIALGKVAISNPLITYP